MGYEDVEAVCFFCEATIKGNQRFMLGGRNLPTRQGRTPNWVKAKPEHLWEWNGLLEFVDGERKEFLFYLCPKHQERKHWQKAFDWAQEQIDKSKS